MQYVYLLLIILLICIVLVLLPRAMVIISGSLGAILGAGESQNNYKAYKDYQKVYSVNGGSIYYDILDSRNDENSDPMYGAADEKSPQELQKAKLNRIIIVDDASKQTRIPYYDRILDQELSWNVKGDIYVPPSSNKQISTIAKRGNASDKARLFRLICHDGNLKKFMKFIYMSDSDVYNEIRKPDNESAEYQYSRGKSHGINVYGALRHHLPKEGLQNPQYLDIGCGSGLITATIAELLGAKEYYGIDISYVENPPAGLKLTVYSTDAAKLPYEDNSFDVITAIMSLHHIKNLPQIATEIMRILRPGGILYIKEHDCWTSIDAMLVDIEHAMYTEVLPDYGYAYYYKNYYGWDRLFTGLKYLHGDYYYTTMNNDMKPTRATYSVYKKV
jgi:ubiquinone/menaquinone biosynthesis C-methylase UbiE